MAKISAIGTVSFFTGNVVSVTEEGEERKLCIGDDVFPNEIITTDELSTVAIDFKNGSRKGLASHERVQILADSSIRNLLASAEGAEAPSVVDQIAAPPLQQPVEVAPLEPPTEFVAEPEPQTNFTGIPKAEVAYTPEAGESAESVEVAQEAATVADSGSTETVASDTDTKIPASVVLAEVAEQKVANQQSVDMGLTPESIPTLTAHAADQAGSPNMAEAGVESTATVTEFDQPESIPASVPVSESEPAKAPQAAEAIDETEELRKVVAATLAAQSPAAASVKAVTPPAATATQAEVAGSESDVDLLVSSVMAGMGMEETAELPDNSLLQSVVQGVIGEQFGKVPGEYANAGQITQALQGVLGGLPHTDRGLPPSSVFESAVQGVLGGGLPTTEKGLLDRKAISVAIHGTLDALPSAGTGLPASDVLQMVVSSVLGQLPAGKNGAPESSTLDNATRGVLDGIAAFRSTRGERLSLDGERIEAVVRGILHGGLDLKADGAPSSRSISTTLKGIVSGFRGVDRRLPGPEKIQAIAHAVQGGDLPLGEHTVPEPELINRVLAAHVSALPSEHAADGGPNLEALIGATLAGTRAFETEGQPIAETVSIALRGVLPALGSSREGRLPKAPVFRSVLNAILLDHMRPGAGQLPTVDGVRAAFHGLIGGLDKPRALLGDLPRFEEAVQSILGGSLPSDDSGLPAPATIGGALQGVLGGVSDAKALNDTVAQWSIQAVLRDALHLDDATELPDAASVRTAMQGVTHGLIAGQTHTLDSDGVLEDDGLRVAVRGIYRDGLLSGDEAPGIASVKSAVSNIIQALPIAGGKSFPSLRAIQSALEGVFSGGLRKQADPVSESTLAEMIEGTVAALPAALRDGSEPGSTRTLVQGLLGAALVNTDATPDRKAIKQFTSAANTAFGNAGRGPISEPVLQELVTGMLRGGIDVSAAHGQQSTEHVLSDVLAGLGTKQTEVPQSYQVVAIVQGLLGGGLRPDEQGLIPRKSVNSALRGVIAALPSDTAGNPMPSGLTDAIRGVLGALPRNAAGVPEPIVTANAMRGVLKSLPEKALGKAGVPAGELLPATIQGVFGGSLPRDARGLLRSETVESAMQGLLQSFDKDLRKDPATIKRLVGATLGDAIPVDKNGLFGAETIAPAAAGVLAAVGYGPASEPALLENAIEGVLGGGISLQDNGLPGPEAIELAFEGVLKGLGATAEQLPDEIELERAVVGTLAGGLHSTAQEAPSMAALKAAVQGLVAGLPTGRTNAPTPAVLRTLVRGALGGGIQIPESGLPSRSVVAATIQSIASGLANTSVKEIDGPVIMEVLNGVLGKMPRVGVDVIPEPEALFGVMAGATEGFSGRAGMLLDGPLQEFVVRGVLQGGLNPETGAKTSPEALTKVVHGTIPLVRWLKGDPEQSDDMLDFLTRGVLGGGFGAGEGATLPGVADMQPAISAVLAGVTEDQGLIPEPEVLEPVVRGIFAGGIGIGADGLPSAANLSTATNALIRALPMQGMPEPDVLQALVKALMGSQLPLDRSGLFSSDTVRPALEGILNGMRAAEVGDIDHASLAAATQGVLAGGVPTGSEGIPAAEPIELATRGVLEALIIDPEFCTRLESMLPAAITGILGGGLALNSLGVPAREAIAPALRGVLGALPRDNTNWPEAGMLRGSILGVLGGELPVLSDGVPNSRAISNVLSGVLAGLPTGAERVPDGGILRTVVSGVLGNGLVAQSNDLPAKEHIAATMEGLVGGLPGSATQSAGKVPFPQPRVAENLVRGLLGMGLPVGKDGLPETKVSNLALQGVLTGLPNLPDGTFGPELLRSLVAGIFGDTLPLTAMGVVRSDAIAAGLRGAQEGWTEQRGTAPEGAWLESMVQGVQASGLELVDGFMPAPVPEIIAESYAGALAALDGDIPARENPVLVRTLAQGVLNGGVTREHSHECIRNVIRGMVSGLNLGDDQLPRPQILQRLVQGSLGGGMAQRGMPEPKVFQHVVGAVLKGLPLKARLPEPAIMQSVVQGVLGEVPAGEKLDPTAITRAVQGVLRGLRDTDRKLRDPMIVQTVVKDTLSNLPKGAISQPPVVQAALQAVLDSLPEDETQLSPQQVEAVLTGSLQPLAGRALSGDQIALLRPMVRNTLASLPSAENGLPNADSVQKTMFTLVEAGVLEAGLDENQTRELLATLAALDELPAGPESTGVEIAGGIVSAGLSGHSGSEFLQVLHHARTVIPVIREHRPDGLRESVISTALHTVMEAAVPRENEEDRITAATAGTLRALGGTEWLDDRSLYGCIFSNLVTAADKKSADELESIAARLVGQLAETSSLTPNADVAGSLIEEMVRARGMLPDQAMDAVVGDVLQLFDSGKIGRMQVGDTFAGAVEGWNKGGNRSGLEPGHEEARELLGAVCKGLHNGTVGETPESIGAALAGALLARNSVLEHLPSGTQPNEFIADTVAGLKVSGDSLRAKDVRNELEEGAVAFVAPAPEPEPAPEQEPVEVTVEKPAVEQPSAPDVQPVTEQKDKAQWMDSAAVAQFARKAPKDAAQSGPVTQLAEVSAPPSDARSKQDLEDAVDDFFADTRAQLDMLESGGEAPQASSQPKEEGIPLDMIGGVAPSVAKPTTPEIEVIQSPFDPEDLRATEQAAEIAAIAKSQLQLEMDQMLATNKGGINHFFGGSNHEKAVYHLDSSASTDVIHDFQVTDPEHEGDEVEIHDLLLNEGLDASDSTPPETLAHYVRVRQHGENTELLVGHEEDRNGDGSVDTFVADHKIVLEEVDLTHDTNGRRMSDTEIIEKLVSKHNLNVSGSAN